MSSEETRKIAELLSKEEDAIQLVRGAVWPSRPGNSCIFPLEKLVGEISEIDDGPEQDDEPYLYTPFETMFRKLYKQTESPIERILFGALSIRLRFGSRPYHIFVHEPAADLGKYIRDFMAYLDEYTSAYACYAFAQGGEWPDENDIWLGAFRWGDPFLNAMIEEANREYVDIVNAVHLVPQSVLPLFGKTIRPDLALWFPADDSVRLLIECDGYEFHSSRDKFRSDRARDRELLEHGYRVLRYSGSEVTSDPIALAKGALDLLGTLSIPVRPNLYRCMVSKLNLLRSYSAGLAGLPESIRTIAELSRALAEACDEIHGSRQVAGLSSAGREQTPGEIRSQLVLALERLDDDELHELLGAVLFGRDHDLKQADAPMKFLATVQNARRHPRDFCMLNLTRRPIDQCVDKASHYLSRSQAGATTS